MIVLPDLDPQDHTNRIAVHARMKQIRKDTHGSYRKMRSVSEAAGYGSRFIEDCEGTTQWGVRRVNKWARLLEHRFTMTITGLTIPDSDLSADLLRLGTPFGGLDTDDLHLLTVVDDLARYRIHHRISYMDVGRCAGIDGSAVRGWEDQPRHLLLMTVQRYTRALGEIQRQRGGVDGWLALEVVPAAVAVTA